MTVARDFSVADAMATVFGHGIPGDIVGAIISYGPPHARHHMLILGDRTHCELRATQVEGGVARMVAVVADQSSRVQ